jgi:hypothetical protein
VSQSVHVWLPDRLQTVLGPHVRHELGDFLAAGSEAELILGPSLQTQHATHGWPQLLHVLEVQGQTLVPLQGL